jgi:uncharacterized protein (TIGR02147 family)
MVFEHATYRSCLKALLAERIARNRSYSLRAMAQSLDVSHSLLSEVISGKANLSQENARRITRRIGLDSRSADYFCLLVQLETSKDPEVRETLLERIRELNPRVKDIHDLSVDAFRQIADWYHAAILEMTFLDPPDFTPSVIARRLGIRRVEAEAALERLCRMGLLEKDSRNIYRKPSTRLRVDSPAPNDALRDNYRQLLAKIDEALETQSPEERLSGGETLAFSREALPRARRAIEDCFQTLIDLSEKTPRKKDIYHLAIHFINLTSSKGKRP